MKRTYMAPEMELLCMEMESACLITSSTAVLDEYAKPCEEGLGRSLPEDWDDEDF